MRKLSVALLLASAISANATDMSVKANAWTAYPYNGSGCYWGVNTEGGVAQADVGGKSQLFATSLVGGNLTAAGAGAGGTVGCIKGNGTSWLVFQATVDYTNITAGGGGASVNSRWSATQVVKFGGLTQLMSLLPNLGLSNIFPVLPAPASIPGLNINLTTSHGYAMIGAKEFDISASFGESAGHTWGVAPLVGAGILNQITDANGKATGAVLDTYAEVIFAGKGFTFTNGNFGGAASLGTQYMAGVALYY